MGRPKKQDEKPKTRMEKVCAVLGLEMHQKFTVIENGHCAAYKESAPYFFTELGICSEKSGELCRPGLLESLLTGEVSAGPLDAYAYRYADAIDAERISRQELRMEVASFSFSTYESKALYAVITPDRPDITWRLEHFVKGKEPVRLDLTNLVTAVETYNRIKMLDLKYD